MRHSRFAARSSDYSSATSVKRAPTSVSFLATRRDRPMPVEAPEAPRALSGGTHQAPPTSGGNAATGGIKQKARKARRARGKESLRATDAAELPHQSRFQCDVHARQCAR